MAIQPTTPQNDRVRTVRDAIELGPAGHEHSVHFWFDLAISKCESQDELDAVLDRFTRFIVLGEPLVGLPTASDLVKVLRENGDLR